MSEACWARLPRWAALPLSLGKNCSAGFEFSDPKSAVGVSHVSPARKGWVKIEATIGSTAGAAQHLYCSRLRSPILIGQGIPLIQPRHRSIRLKLLSTKAFPDGVVHLDYGITAPS